MITHYNLEHESGWKYQTQNVGGKQPPDAYGLLQYADAMTLYTQGKAYSNWLAVLKAPILPGTSPSLAFDLWVDANAMQIAQSLEFDVRFSIDTFDYNRSGQVVVADRGKVQVAGDAGGWQDTGWAYGKFPISQWTPCQFNFSLDTIAHTSKTTSIVLVDSCFPIPDKLAISAKPLSWPEGAYIQLQQDIGAIAGGFTERIRNLRLIWN